MKIFAPVGFLSFFSPAHLLLTTPTFFQNILSSYPGQYSIVHQYTAPLTPFVFISAIYGLKNLINYSKKTSGNFLNSFIKANLNLLIILALIVLTIKYSRYNSIDYKKWHRFSNHTEILNKFITFIPQSCSVSAQDVLVPHLSNRKLIYLFPVINDADYILLDTTSGKWPISGEEYVTRVTKLLKEGRYGVEKVGGNTILLLKKGYPTSKNKNALLFLQTGKDDHA